MKRVDHIDVAKAVGIMLIIASHNGVSPSVQESSIYQCWNSTLNSFYVPLFFLLSGVFESSASFEWRKLRARMYRLLRYVFIFLCFGFISAGVIKNTWNITDYSRNTVVWFLFTLVWITLLMQVVKRLPNKTAIITTFFIAAMGVVSSYFQHSFCYMGQAMLCFPFYYVGYRYQNFIKVPAFRWQHALTYFSVWLAFMLIFYSEQNVSLNYVSQNYIAFYIEALCGSLCVVELSKCVKWKVIVFYGKNTIVPMMIHLSIIWLLAIIFGDKFFYYESSSLCRYYITSIAICAICGICIPLFRNGKYDIFK